MKPILVIGLFLLSSLTKGQIFSFDKGSGNRNDLSTAVTALNLIAKNQPASLFQYFSAGYKLDSTLIKKECAYTATNFPFTEGHYNVFFYDSTNTGLWYERTYYSENESRVDYLFQVFIKMDKTAQGIIITDIRFRHGDKIIPRDKEVRKMGNQHDRNNPPPPPSPFPLEH